MCWEAINSRGFDRKPPEVIPDFVGSEADCPKVFPAILRLAVILRLIELLHILFNRVVLGEAVLSEGFLVEPVGQPNLLLEPADDPENLPVGLRVYQSETRE